MNTITRPSVSDQLTILGNLRALVKIEPDNIEPNARITSANYAIAYVIKSYGLSENKVALSFNGSRSTMNQWTRGISIPLADSLPAVSKGIKKLTGLENGDDAIELLWFLYRYFDPKQYQSYLSD